MLFERLKKKATRDGPLQEGDFGEFFHPLPKPNFSFLFDEGETKGTRTTRQKETNHEKIMGYHVNGRRLITKRRVVTP